MHLSLDLNIEIYPVRPEEKFTMALATSLSRAGAIGEKEDGDQAVWRPDGKGRRGLEEDYEYVMYGKVSPRSLRRYVILDLEYRYINLTKGLVK
jgi:DNA-directed RNA polymerase I, II, and III subunit RPABC3